MIRFITCLFVLIFTFSLTANDAKKVAVVKMLKGDVKMVDGGKSISLKADDWVVDGAMIKTAEKSFCKLVFVDKSSMTVGPNSEMKIEKYVGEEAGVLDLVKGKIRAQVTKDYLKMKDKDKSKMFVKTPNAVMGVRGTDFMVTANKSGNSSVVLFEGSVVYNKLDSKSIVDPQRLESVVNRGVQIMPGEFSVVSVERSIPTVPSRLNNQQLEGLQKNETFSEDRAPSNDQSSVKKSVVPPGLSGSAVANNPEGISKEVQKLGANENKVVSTDSQPKGYVDGEKVKPANGSFLHIDSGVVIPPDANATFDPVTQTYIPSGESGQVGSDGNFLPPKNVEITDDGKILVAVEVNGKTQVQEIQAPSPVVKANSVSLGQVSGVLSRNPGMATGAGPVSNDVLNANFNPSGLNDFSNNQQNSSGGINNVNDAVINNSGRINVPITVKPRDPTAN